MNEGFVSMNGPHPALSKRECPNISFKPFFSLKSGRGEIALTDYFLN